MSTPWSALEVGDELARHTVSLTRESLVRYAGASGDFNPIHYRDDVALSVGLAGVLAHGMLTMGFALGPLTNWLAGRGLVTSYQVRFTKPVYVPQTGAVDVTVVATVSKLEDPLPGQMTVALRVTIGEDTAVLGKALAVVSPS